MRVHSNRWRQLPPGPVAELYKLLHTRLQDAEGMSKVNADSACNYLYAFVCRATPDNSPDLRLLSGAQEDAERGEAAWQSLQEDHRWNPRHLVRVRHLLGRALASLVPALACIVNPVMRSSWVTKRSTYIAAHSHQRTFDLHDCLPLRVRKLSPTDPDYRLMCRIIEEMINHLRSVSKTNVQKMAIFLDSVIRDMFPPELQSSDDDERWTYLKQCRPQRWLQRLREVGQSDKHISFDHFKRQVRYLHILHAKVLNPGVRVTIPMPAAGGRIFCSEGLHELSSASQNTDTTAADEDGVRRLRELVSTVRGELCGTGAPEDADRPFAFTPTEIRAIVDSAATPKERLIVLIFFTTGLRIGGLCRLQVPEYLHATRCNVRGVEVPESLVTVEKGGKIRRIRLCDSCRVLVTGDVIQITPPTMARWYRQGRAAGTSSYLFPGADAEKAMATRSAWQLCRSIFERAGVRGSHVHPHTFRHTVIQMLYMKGMF